MEMVCVLMIENVFVSHRKVPKPWDVLIVSGIRRLSPLARRVFDGLKETERAGVPVQKGCVWLES